MKPIRLCAFALIAPLLAACGSWTGDWNTAEVRAMPQQGDDFQRALHKEYASLAQEEVDEGHWSAGGYYNKKARTAAAGQPVHPTTMEERTIPADKSAELSESRAKLVKTLEAGGAKKAPTQAARAQAMFDCWMEEQEENHQSQDIARCRNEFLVALNQVTVAMTPTAPAPTLALSPPSTPMSTYTIYFAHDSAVLNEEGRKAVQDIAARAKSGKAITIVVEGHADRSGERDYNRKLADRRAAAVADALKAAGVMPQIAARSLGEEQPAVPTADKVKEPRNRRAEVRVQ